MTKLCGFLKYKDILNQYKNLKICELQVLENNFNKQFWVSIINKIINQKQGQYNLTSAQGSLEDICISNIVKWCSEKSLNDIKCIMDKLPTLILYRVREIYPTDIWSLIMTEIIQNRERGLT